MIKDILLLIEERYKECKTNLKKHKSTTTTGYAYDLGAFEEIKHIRESIEEFE